MFFFAVDFEISSLFWYIFDPTLCFWDKKCPMEPKSRPALKLTTFFYSKYFCKRFFLLNSVVIVWYLDLQLLMQSVPIITRIIQSLYYAPAGRYTTGGYRSIEGADLFELSLSPLKLWIRIPFRRDVFDATLCDKVCQLLLPFQRYERAKSDQRPFFICI